MPGLFLSTASGAGDTSGPESLTRLLESRRHFDHYETEVVRDDGRTRFGYTTYEGYPTRYFERDGLACYLEGAIYDGRATDDDLASVAEALLDPDAPRDDVADWLAETDGDFVFCAVDEAGRVALLNDVFGRLPVYYADADGAAVIGREPGSLLDAIEFTFDRLALAEVLLFAYTLGDRTLWNEISKLPPGSALLVRDGAVEVDRLHRFDFDERRHADRTAAENAEAMARLFEEACRSRGRVNDENVVSLSGGHDSRAVAAGFRNAGLPWTAATFVKRSVDESDDLRIAGEVAGALDADWEQYELPPVRGAEMRTLLGIKSGLNHLGMSYILSFFEGIRDRHGPSVTYLTGDGGDKAVPDLSPPRAFDDLDELVDYTVAKNEVFPLSTVSEITGVEPDSVRAEVRRVLDAYPERDFRNKYVHFLVRERGLNWLFEGEDRNRFFFWSTTPFYSTDFFTYAMNVPDEQKAKNDLYREFLSALWPRSIRFEDADYRTPMASSRYDILQYGLKTIDRHPVLNSIAQTVYRGELSSAYHPNVSRLFRRQLDRCDALDDVLDRRAIESVAENRSDYGRQQVFTLLTITAAVDHQACGTPLSEIPADEVFEDG